MRRVVAVAIVANLIGGMSYVPAKVALTGLSETTLVVVRTVVALAVLLPLGGRGVRRLLAAPGADRRQLFAMGILGYALPLVLGKVLRDSGQFSNGQFLSDNLTTRCY